MKNLFKKKYLIAVYDKNDEDLLGVFDNPSEMEDFLGTKWATTIISRYIKTFGTFPVIDCNRYILHFINVYENHNDVFAEEDKAFLDFFPKDKGELVAQYCEAHSITARTYYRRTRSQTPQK